MEGKRSCLSMVCVGEIVNTACSKFSEGREAACEGR